MRRLNLVLPLISILLSEWTDIILASGQNYFRNRGIADPLARMPSATKESPDAVKAAGGGGQDLSSEQLEQEEGVVYLYSFPAVKLVYSICPFAIKVESYLRIHKIPYKVVHTSKFGPKGQMPYIRLNNETIGDSNVILTRLADEFDIESDGHGGGGSSVSFRDRAVGHAFTRMIEEHTAQLGFYYRYGLCIGKFAQGLDMAQMLGPKVLDGWVKNQPNATKEKTKARGLTRHTDEELWKFCADDLRAISDYLGKGDEHQFFLGDEPTEIDCTLFGHLVQFLYIPIDFPQKQYLHDHCSNVVNYVEKFKATYWLDWDEKCGEKIEKRF